MTWTPLTLDPATELDKAMAELRRALAMDKQARNVAEDGTGAKADALDWLREASDTACDVHEALHWSRTASRESVVQRLFEDAGHGTRREDIEAAYEAGVMARREAGQAEESGEGYNTLAESQQRDREDTRCPHGMFFTGAGACPACSSSDNHFFRDGR